MDRSPGSTVSPGLQILLISAVAAGFGVLAGGILVYLQQQQSGTDETKRRQRSALISSRSNSSSAPVPLFDSVQGWLQSQPSGSPGASQLVATQRSQRSATLSGRPPSVAEVDESEFGDGDASTGTRSTSRAFNKRDVPLSDWEIHESEVEICKRDDGSLWHLGGGSFGQVFKAIRNGVQPVAVKVFPANATDVQMADFQKEVVILKSCRDRNIVQFLGACITDTQTCLVTEYMEGGDLFNALHRGHKGNLTWHKRSANPADPLPANPVQGLGKRIALDIARGLHFLHTHRIVHMDVKSPNVLLGRNNLAKLADVGLAKFLHKDYLSVAKSVGTFAWSAPEVLMGSRCSEKVDIFSLGVVLWELVTGESPARGRLRPVKVPQECSEAVADLIAACMEADPADRPSAKDVVEMLSQQVEKPVAGSRRSARKQEVGAASGRVLDDLIRHAQVLGMQDFTRSDALATAEYRNDFKQYKQYMAELKKVWPDVSQPLAKGSPEFERVVELVSSFRQLLSIFLADATDSVREIRNVDLQKAGRAKDAPKPKAEDMANPQTSTMGKREEGIDWRPTLQAMRLTPPQAAAIVDARAQVTVKLDELTKQRKEIITALQTLTMEGDNGYGSAVDKTDELRRNMQQEGISLHEYHYWFFAVALKPEQEAAAEMTAFPFFPDAVALSDLIVHEAVHAMANATVSTAASSEPRPDEPPASSEE